MAASDAALVIAGNALAAVHTHIQLHSAAPGVAGTSNVIGGARRAVTFTVDGDGDLTLTGTVAYTGLASNQAVAFVTIWNALTSGTLMGTYALVGDNTANSAGEYTVTAGSIPLVAA